MSGNEYQGSQSHFESQPKPDQPIVLSSQVAPPPTGRAKRKPNKKTTGLIVIGVVLALVVAGVAGWALWPRGGPDPVEPSGSAQPQPTPTILPPAQTSSSVSIVKVASALTSDLEKPDAIEEMGVWSGVAVFGLYYKSPGSTIIRGVSVDTGQVLWTYSETLEGYAKWPVGVNPTNGVDLNSGSLVVAMQKVGPEPDNPEKRCPGQTYFLILNPATGEGWHGGAIDPQCVDDGPGVKFVFADPIAYRDGILVVDLYYRYTAAYVSKGFRTVAYRDTDLNTAIWQVEIGDRHFGPEGHTSTDVLLFGDLVRTVSGVYVSINDGRPSSFDCFDGMLHCSGFTQANDTVLTVTDSGATTDDALKEYTLLGYASPDAEHPSWRYTVSPEGMYSSLWDSCVTSQAFISYKESGYYSDTKIVTAVSLTDGHELWTMSFLSTDESCSVLQNGDQELVAFATESALLMVDGETGAEYARFSDPSRTRDWAGSEMYRCGQSGICLVNYEEETITAIDYSSASSTILWTEQFPPGTTRWNSMVFTTESGFVMMSTAVDDLWFLIVN